MTPKSIGVKDECVFVQTTVLILNPPYCSGDIAQEIDHHYLQMPRIDTWGWHGSQQSFINAL